MEQNLVSCFFAFSPFLAADLGNFRNRRLTLKITTHGPQPNGAERMIKMNMADVQMEISERCEPVKCFFYGYKG